MATTVAQEPRKNVRTLGLFSFPRAVAATWNQNKSLQITLETPETYNKKSSCP